ncbi:MAG: P63C domain-containing protein [Sphingomonadaceae bacterium]|nr:P63C domain-containing protein [Sphingomonadaceae bacterium]
MAKDDKIIEPLDATFDEVAAAMTPKSQKLETVVSRALPAFAQPDEIPVAIAKGTMKIGDLEIDCVVLADETRLISDRGASKALGGKRGGSHWKRMKEDGALSLPPYISAANLREFIPNDLIYILTNPVQYKATKSGAIGNGLLATAFPKVLKVWQRAYEAGVLKPQQIHIAEQAIRLLEGLDEVAIVALIDEATGYQEIRRHDELQQILSAYVLPEHRPYLKSVPTEFFKELYRVYGWNWTPDNRGPRYAGKLLRKLIYEQLPEPVLPELDKLNPTNKKYQRKGKHFQSLTEEVGLPHMQGQLSGVMALLRATPSKSPKQFEKLFTRAYGDQYELALDDDD